MILPQKYNKLRKITHVCKVDFLLGTGFMWEKLLMFSQGIQPIEPTTEENISMQHLYWCIYQSLRFICESYPSSLLCPFIFWSSILVAEVVTSETLKILLLDWKNPLQTSLEEKRQQQFNLWNTDLPKSPGGCFSSLPQAELLPTFHYLWIKKTQQADQPQHVSLTVLHCFCMHHLFRNLVLTCHKWDKNSEWLL